MNKAQLQILKDEIANDPLTRGYSGMTDAQIADFIEEVKPILKEKGLMVDE